MALLQQRLEAEDQVLDNIHKLMERWEKRITLGNLRIAERFANSEIYLALHCTIKDTGEMWVARFDKVFGERSIDPIGGEQRILADGENGPVLVGVIQFENSPECRVATMVRFERVDSFHGRNAHTLYLSSLVPFVTGHILCNREFDLASGRVAASYPYKLVCEVIERAPQVVDDVSGGSHGVEGKSAEYLSLLRCLSAMKINLCENRVQAVVPESQEFGVKITEMLLGPLDLYPNQDQSGLRGEIS